VKRPERIGVFGGTFDPVHNGHLKAALAVGRRFGLSRVLFVPSNIPPHKADPDLAEHRPQQQGGPGLASTPQRAQRLHLRQLEQRRLERIAFDIEFGRRPGPQQLRQFMHVSAADMPRVRPRMHGDAVGAGVQRDARSRGDRRDAEAARVAQQRDFVEVDAEPGHDIGDG